jgi:hypothetical protein
VTEKAIDAESDRSKAAERSSSPTHDDRLEPKSEHALAGGISGSAGTALTGLQLQRQLGNAAVLRSLGSGQTLNDQPTPAAMGNSATVRLLGSTSTASPEQSQARSGGRSAAASGGAARVGFVREEGLNLREGADQASRSLAELRFGTRVHVLEDERQHPGWHKVAVQGGTGFVYAPRIHFPPPWLIEKDPALRLIRVKPGQTFWGLVKEQYGIQGNEGTPDQNINHFINAIRAVNKPEAFKVETDWLDDIGNAMISGRDASDTLLKANVDLWIPSFGVAARMDVGSGTVTGEIARFIKKIEQKLEDFKTACLASGKYIPGAIAHHAGEVAKGLLKGLIDFAIDAAKILAISTAIGALIGSLFGGVGAIPGAEIGFEIGLLLLEYYGLALLIEAVLSIAGNLLSQLGRFISLVWNANGDEKVLEEAGKTLADALGILVSAALLALAAYLMKKGAKAFGETKFAKTVGETQLAKWLAERQRMTTTRETLAKLAAKDLKVGQSLEGLMGGSRFTPSQKSVRLRDVQQYAERMRAGQWDWNRPVDKIIVDANGNVLAGHHRIVAAKLAGVEIPESGIYVSRTPQMPELTRTWADVVFE